jgi:hypothetical protein
VSLMSLRHCGVLVFQSSSQRNKQTVGV